MTTAADRGWGPGWPNCQTDKLVTVEAAGIRWKVRREVAPLFVELATQWHARVERLDPAQCWSFACRAIRGGTSPSNHSWGLADDFNSAKHPLGARGTFNAAQVRAIRALLGLPWFRNIRWGGDYASRPDEMHVEYVGTLAQAVGDVAALRRSQRPQPTPDPTPQPALALVEEDVALIKVKTSDDVWVTDGLTRRLVKDPAELADLRKAGFTSPIVEVRAETLAAIKVTP